MVEKIVDSQSVQIQLMSSRIKTHRRNQALHLCQQNYRFSIPVESIASKRLSFEPIVEGPLTFRTSDISKLPNEAKIAPLQQKSREIATAKTICHKTSSNLLSTLQNLQEKLKLAKKQFSVGVSEQNSGSFQLNSFKEESLSSGQWEESVLEKLEESTINLESQKRLIDAVKSKERIIWAQRVRTYYLGEVVKGIAGVNERALEHLTISLEILKNCSSLALPTTHPLLQYPLLPPASKKTLVLDLDQTLFHCSEQRNSPQDMEITLKFEEGEEKAFVSIRPYAISFLKRMRKHFQIVAFTASERSYADAILDEIDSERELIEFRLYREHCIKLNSKIYAKDLRVLGRDLSQVVLIDNSPFSYLYQISNGIPILPYYAGEDRELLALEKYLETLRYSEDVRKANRETFKLHRYIEFEDCEQLAKELYCSS